MFKIYNKYVKISCNMKKRGNNEKNSNCNIFIIEFMSFDRMFAKRTRTCKQKHLE